MIHFVASTAGPVSHRANRQVLAEVAQGVWSACGGPTGQLPGALTIAIDRAARDRGRAPALELTQIARADLRTVVERASATAVGTLALLAAELGARAAGARHPSIGELGIELGIGLHVLEDLKTTMGPEAARADLWQLRPTWSWVWTSEAADDASWVRGVRWAKQVAERGSDPLPLARFLAQFSMRRGAAEARAQVDAARDAIQRATRDVG
ncbi:MAG: hypothetical protein H0T42_24480 [Deltaproteobacteria bacterium]|nr:hypothetical protein [Deltaproteobacteria bacterium]